MDVAHTLSRLSSAGITLEVHGDDLDVTYQSEPTPQQWEWLKANKPVLLRLLSAPPPDLTEENREAIRETIEERAAIHEHDGAMPREEAQQAAQSALRVYRYRLTDKPDVWLTMICSGYSLEDALLSLATRFSGRVLDVVEDRG